VWLTDQGITTLGDCTTQVLGAYGRHVRDSGTARITVHSGLSSLTRLWVFDQLSGRPSGIGCPPWEIEGWDDYLPPATSGGENATEAVAEQAMGPLLLWAIRTVEELSDDILAAWAERNRLREAAAANVATPASRAALRAFMDRIDTGGLPIPTTEMVGQSGHLRAPTSPRSPVPRSIRSTTPRAITAGGRPRLPGPAPVRSALDQRPARAPRGERPSITTTAPRAKSAMFPGRPSHRS